MRKTKHLVALLTVVVMVLTFACGLLAACNKTYEITFDANGGKYGTDTTITAQTEKNGLIATEPTRPTREGYTFNGYNTSKDGKGDKVTFGVDGYKFKEDTTVYAQWKVNADPDPDEDKFFVITLDANGGKFANGNSTITQQTNENGVLESLSVPTRDEYIFDGYNIKADGTGFEVTTSYEFAENTTIFAQWKAEANDDIPDEPIDPVEITLVVGDGTLPEDAPTTVMTNEYGRLSEEDLPVPTPNNENARFLGWYSDTEGNKKAVNTTFTEPSEIYAIYSHEFVITLVVKSSEGKLPDGAPTELITVNGKLTAEALLSVIPESNIEHMSFTGWSTTSNGNNMITLDTVFEKDTNIYAIFVRDDGLWLGRTGTSFIAELPRNTGNQSEVEYWLGGEDVTIALNANDEVCFYINGKLCNDLWITGTGVKTKVEPKPSYVTVTKTAEFMIFLKDYSNGAGTDYVVEFRTSTEADEGDESAIPVGAAAMVITIGSFDPITIYLAKANGTGVTEAELSNYCIYTFSDEIFGKWTDSATKGRCATAMTTTATVTKVPKGWIIRNGWSTSTGDGGFQTANIEDAIEAGGTYVIQLPAESGGEATVTKIVTSSAE